MVPPDPVEEGDDVVVTLVLDNPAGFEVSVQLLASNDTARRGEDFSFGSSATMTIAPGELAATHAIETLEDRVVEDVEDFDLTVLGSGLNPVLQFGDTTADATIIDDDHAPVIVSPLSLRVSEFATEVASLVASDDDGDEVVWEITGGADRGRFTLTRGGVLSFVSAQSYDSPGDANRDRRYQVIVTVSDGFNPVAGRFTVELLRGLVVGDVTRTTAQVTVNVPHASIGETVSLQYGTDDWGPTQQRTANGGAAVFSLSGLDAGSRYTVRASLDPAPLVSEDWLSAKFETRVSLTYGPDAIWATPTGNGGYELGWAPTNAFQPVSPPGRSGYRIARVHYGAQPSAVFEITNSDATSFTDPGPLVAGGTYYYVIWVINRDGPSYEAASVAVTPQASEGCAAPPTAPRNLRWDRDAPPGQVRLLWDPPADNTADSYIVALNRVGDDSPKGNWTPITLGATTATTFTDHLSRDDFPDDGYIYRAYYVHSVNAAGARSPHAWKLVPIYTPTCDGCVNAIQPPP